MPMHDPIPDRFATDDGEAGPSAASPRAPGPMTEERLRDWVRFAKPRARLIYARGSFVDQHVDKDIARLVRELHDAGWLRMHLSRPEKGGPIDYLAVRTDKPLMRGSVI